MPRTKGRQGPSVLWLLEHIDRFIDENDLESDGYYLSWLVVRDQKTIQRLRDGGDLTTTLMDDFISFMRKPDKMFRTTTKEGSVTQRALKPITIKPRSIYD